VGRGTRRADGVGDVVLVVRRVEIHAVPAGRETHGYHDAYLARAGREVADVAAARRARC